jgi:hypothetical protein
MQNAKKGDREVMADLGVQLLHLCVLRAQACGQEDGHRVRTLQAEIERAKAARKAVLPEGITKAG